ncbi:hypothetical protein OG400_21165 [Micromonospora ureilytica]|uniref:hypothetical protein n=1 Tax=Micromonospora ureilytica TaxID=709868 RepID=UPI002E111695|nr:hypothetical protein OG400_21165 [Micromonospora ureilytica]
MFALARGWVQENLHTEQTRASFTAYVNKKTGHAGQFTYWVGGRCQRTVTVS